MGPVTQEPIPERIVIKVPKRAPAPAAPPPEPEKPAEKSLTAKQFAENTFDDIWEFAKSIVQIVPEMGKLGLEAVKDPKQYGKDLKKVFTSKAGTEAMKEFGWGLVPFSQVIREGPGILKSKPFSAGVVEVVAALPLLGGMLKATGTVAKASGVGAKAEKLIKIGAYLEELPGKWARAAVDKTVGKTAKAFGGEWDLAKRREGLDIYADVKTGERAAKDARFERFRGVMSKLTKDEYEEFTHRAYGGLLEGEKASPNVRAALDLKGEINATELAAEFASREMLPAGRQEGALFKKFAAERGFDIEDAAQLTKAKEMYALLKEKPVYMRHMRINEDPNLIEKIFEGSAPEIRRSGGAKVGALERFTGKGAAYERNPLKIIARELDDHEKIMTRLKWVEALRSNPELITAKGAKTAQLDYEGVLQKYFPDKVRSEALKQFTDPTMVKLIKWEFSKHPQGIPGAMLRMYDRLQSVFARMATKWRPSYHIGNVYSNAVMSALFGGDPILAARLGKSAMPARIRSRTSTSAGDLARTPGWLESKLDIATGADALARAGMLSARTAARIAKTGASAEEVFKLLPKMLQSTDEFTKLQVDYTLLRDTIARRSPQVEKMDRIIGRLYAKEQALAKTIEWTGPAQFKAGPNAIRLEELRQKINLLETKKLALVGDLTADKLKAAEAAGRLPELKPMVDAVRKDINHANAFIGEYDALDAFERSIMRRVIPFYPWVRAMSMLAFRLPFIAPVKSFMWHRFSEMMQDITNDPDLPPRLKGYIPVGVTESGKTVWLNASAYSPFNALRTTQVGGLPVPSFANIVEKNPLVALAFGFHGGKTLWNVGNIPHGEGIVSIADGAFARFGPDGRLHEEIPQTPLISGLVNYFPVTQQLKSILQPWWTNRFNWYGMPQAVLNSDGTPRYPREAIERWGAALGLPLMARTKEELVRQEKMKVMKVMRNLEKVYAGEDEEGKRTIRMYVEDYKNGDYRHFGER